MMSQGLNLLLLQCFSSTLIVTVRGIQAFFIPRLWDSSGLYYVFCRCELSRRAEVSVSAGFGVS